MHQRKVLSRARLAQLSIALFSLRRTNDPTLSGFESDGWNNVWRAMLEKCHNLQPRPKTIRELKVALELIWKDLPLESINKVIKSFTKRLRKYMGTGTTGGGHIEDKLQNNIKCV